MSVSSDEVPSPLSVLGLGPAEELLYRALMRTPSLTMDSGDGTSSDETLIVAV